jgi:hypothetical protein
VRPSRTVTAFGHPSTAVPEAGGESQAGSGAELRPNELNFAHQWATHSDFFRRPAVAFESIDVAPTSGSRTG